MSTADATYLRTFVHMLLNRGVMPGSMARSSFVLPVPMQALKRLLGRFESLPGLNPTEDEAKWFLRDRSFDVEEAYTKLVTCLRWRKEFNVHHVSFENVRKEAATGKAYLHEHKDIHDRPVLVVRVSRWDLMHARAESPLRVYSIH